MADLKDPARNHLISRLKPEDAEALRPSLEFVELKIRQSVTEPGKQITHVYFPVSGIISVVATAGHDREIEVGMIGREGFTGHAVILGDGRSSHSTYTQISGSAYRITATLLRDLVEKSGPLRDLLLRFIQSFLIQA